MKVFEQKMVTTSIGIVPLFVNIPFVKDNGCQACGDSGILIRKYTDIVSARNVLTGSYQLVYSIRHYCDSCAGELDLDIFSGELPYYQDIRMPIADGKLIQSKYEYIL